MNSHQDDYLLKTSSNSCLQASHFALIKLLFAYFKQPKQIFLLRMEPSLDSFFAFFKQFNFYGVPIPYLGFINRVNRVCFLYSKILRQGPEVLTDRACECDDVMLIFNT